MKVIPVRQYSEPSFPTRSILDERPELLRFVPKRWQRNPVVLTALTSMCALALGAQALADQAKTQPTVRVAPIFEHGEGQGSFGCKAINPPVFLSEDEARKVILDEAKRVGIRFKADSLTLDNFPVPITDRFAFLNNEADVNGKPKDNCEQSQRQIFRLDGTDAARKISFEYVSYEDFESWEKRPQDRLCTVESPNIKQAAVSLSQNLAQADLDGAVAVFYDPCVGLCDAEKATGFKIDYEAKDMAAEYAKRLDKARQLSSEELRKQVQDFIKWLKAEGVI